MNKTHPKPRDGALLICVLVCLLVASAMVTATTRSALQSRRNVRLQHQMRQTELLLDAGVLRAASQLQLSDDYEGETWRPNGAIGRFGNPLVEIRISAGEKKGDSRHVEVIASLGIPDDPQQINASLTRRTHTFSIELSNISPTPESPTAE
jgi:hypothetical protein